MTSMIEEIQKIKKVTKQWTYVIEDLNGKEIVQTFSAKELQKTSQSLELKKKWIKKLIIYVQVTAREVKPTST